MGSQSDDDILKAMLTLIGMAVVGGCAIVFLIATIVKVWW